MKALKIMGLLLSVTILFTACHKNEVLPSEEGLQEQEYLIFGRYYGFCGGEKCIEIYRIDQAHVYEDILDHYPNSNKFYEGKFVELPDSLYNHVKDLYNSIPDQLYQENEKVIGQPDAGDWGGYYFEIKLNGKHQFWLIDKAKGNIPAYMQPFVDQLEAKINKLSDIE